MNEKRKLSVQKLSENRLVNFLFRRIMPGLLFLAVFILSIFINTFPFLLLVAVLNIQASREVQEAIYSVGVFIPKLLLIVCNVSIVFGAYHFKFVGLTSAYIMSIAIIVLHFSILDLDEGHKITLISSSVFCITYLGLLSSFAIFTVFLNFGSPLVFILIATTAGGDLGAYFIGKKFGKHPFFASISPSKTIEGVVGYFLATTGFSYLFFYTFQFFGLYPRYFEWWIPLVFGLIGLVFGTFGDLVESKFKRVCQIKDSSDILLGHGGILDRLDSILFTAPFFYLAALLLL